MAGDWLKMIGDVAEMLGVGDEARNVLGGVSSYAEGRSTQTDADETEAPYAYERWLTRPRDPGINDR